MRAPGPDTASVESKWASKNVPDVGGDVCNVQVPLKPALVSKPFDEKLTLKRPLVDVNIVEGTVGPENCESTDVQSGVIHVDILNVS
jgi:hypothetical protein